MKTQLEKLIKSHDPSVDVPTNDRDLAEKVVQIVNNQTQGVENRNERPSTTNKV